MTVIWGTKEQWFEIYVNGDYICDVLAVNMPHALLKAHREREVKKALEGNTNHCYTFSAKEKEVQMSISVGERLYLGNEILSDEMETLRLQGQSVFVVFTMRNSQKYFGRS